MCQQPVASVSRVRLSVSISTPTPVTVLILLPALMLPPAALPVCLACLLRSPCSLPLSKSARRHWQEQGGGGGGGVVDTVSVASAIFGRVVCIGRRRRTALMPTRLARNVS